VKLLPVLAMKRRSIACGLPYRAERSLLRSAFAVIQIRAQGVFSLKRRHRAKAGNLSTSHRMTGWRRALTSAIPGSTRRAAGVVGIIFLEIGFALTLVSFKGGTLPQWNGLCHQGLGQVLGLTAGECALAAHVAPLTGWMIGQGLVLLVSFAILQLISRTSPSTDELTEPS
jgi:hypothetical protein